MATVYNWGISQMNEVPQDGSLFDVVVAVYWRREAKLDTGIVIYTSDTFGIYYCPTPSETDFTAYPDLTFEQVCGWLDAGLDVASIDKGLDINIEQQVNPPVVNLPFPWTPTPVPPTPDTSGTSGTSGTNGISGTSGI
jgi:hypothetical protein